MELNDLRVSIREVSGGEREHSSGTLEVGRKSHFHFLHVNGSSFTIRLIVLVVRCVQMCVWQYLEIFKILDMG